MRYTLVSYKSCNIEFKCTQVYSLKKKNKNLWAFEKKNAGNFLTGTFVIEINWSKKKTRIFYLNKENNHANSITFCNCYNKKPTVICKLCVIWEPVSPILLH